MLLLFIVSVSVRRRRRSSVAYRFVSPNQIKHGQREAELDQDIRRRGVPQAGRLYLRPLRVRVRGTLYTTLHRSIETRLQYRLASDICYSGGAVTRSIARYCALNFDVCTAPASAPLSCVAPPLTDTPLAHRSSSLRPQGAPTIGSYPAEVSNPKRNPVSRLRAKYWKRLALSVN